MGAGLLKAADLIDKIWFAVFYVYSSNHQKQYGDLINNAMRQAAEPAIRSALGIKNFMFDPISNANVEFLGRSTRQL